MHALFRYTESIDYDYFALLIGGGNGFQMSFGIGAFPFGFFATNFNLGESGHTHAHGTRGHGTGGAPEGSAQFEEEQFLHKVTETGPKCSCGLFRMAIKLTLFMIFYIRSG